MISSTNINGPIVNTQPNYMFGVNANLNEAPSLSIAADGSLNLGDFNISVKELVACLKAAKRLAMEEYPEEFV